MGVVEWDGKGRMGKVTAKEWKKWDGKEGWKGRWLGQDKRNGMEGLGWKGRMGMVEWDGMEGRGWKGNKGQVEQKNDGKIDIYRNKKDRI